MFARRTRNWQRGIAGCALGVLATALVLAPSDAAVHRAPKRPAAHLVQVGGVGAFTPATADPRLAAIFARGAAAGASFRFTPSGAPGRRAVTVAIRARSTTRPTRGTQVDLAQATPASSANIATTPVAYNLGVAVGWKQFSLSGDFSKIDAGVLPGGRELMDVGVSYGRGRWSTRLALGSDRNLDNRILGPEHAYSLDLGTSYSLTHNFDLMGGVRYRSLRDRLDAATDDRRDAQSVYLGTTFRF